MMQLLQEQDQLEYQRGCILGRANLRTLIVYYENSSLEKAEKIENYYGFENGINGNELYLKGIKQAQNIAVQVKKEEVIKIEIVEDGFKVVTVKEEFNTKSLILATGNKKSKPQIEEIEKFEGKGISYCAVCDGFFYKNRNVAVLGSGNYAISETNELINIVSKIELLTNGEKSPEFRADNVNINTKKIKKIIGNKKVEGIEFEDGTTTQANGIFIAQGIARSSDFAKKLGVITNNDIIVVNEKMETNVKGIYACGDCTGGLLQISKAVYEGTVAGIQIIKYIRNLKDNN